MVELAEYLGSRAIPQDVLLRRLRLEASARADYEVVNVETRTMLDAYAAGVNALVQATDRLPIEYQLLSTSPEPWQPWDACAVFKVRHVFTGGVWQGKLWRARLLRQIGPELTAKLYADEPSGQPLIIPPGLDYCGPALNGLEALRAGTAVVSVLQELEGGSNNWVLSGRTQAPVALRCSPAIPTGRSIPPTCSIKITSPAPSSMPWDCRSQAFQGCPIRPQPCRRLVCHHRHGRLSGPLYRTLPPRQPAAL